MKLPRLTVLLACTALAGCAGAAPVTTATIQADLTVLSNALNDLEPLVKAAPGSAAVYAQIVAALGTVEQAEASAAPTTTTVSTITGLLTAVGPAIIGLFPGGGTAVTIAEAVVSLLPELESLAGIASATPNRRVFMSVEAAHAVLDKLPAARM